ncbi:77e92a88-0be9-401f-bf77-6a25c516cc72 [Sclerotinia trifoliorum]|uniref:77e92a88-0be9-401f-bf77-6a25c516cc72 n=1 Tax=Sclerotinia trifoliorum TaxID=28548 RepID=A0A8H2ZMF1_9HELO|nr:77e92a88-0be9-401f-bf77-6a25c516cc72 [Sclerotinia trifoliorum]
MRSSLPALILLLSVVYASPLQKAAATPTAVKSAAAAANSTVARIPAASTSTSTASAASVLTASAYNDFQISSGTAGTAQDEANALFTAIDRNNLGAVSASDLKIIQGIHDAAEKAETDAFNPAIEAASGDDATALQNGKIKNKVLKLTAEVLGIQVKAAQGGDDSDLEAEQKKLANNVKLDIAAEGETSTAVNFDATS